MRTRPLALAALGLLAALASGPAPLQAQPYARFAVHDSMRVAAVRGSGGGYEAAWNTLLVSGLRAELAKADSARALLTLAEHVARAEPEAFNTHIASDALALRARWSVPQKRERVAAAVAESLGVAAQGARRFADADSALGAALERYRALGERRRTAWLLGTLGQCAFQSARYDRADSLYTLALAARRALPDLRMTGASLNALGSTNYARGRYAEARGYLEGARAVREQTGERAALGQTWNFLGTVLNAMGKSDSARIAFDRALALTVAEGDSARTLEVLVNLQGLLASEGNLAAAQPLGVRAVALATARGDVERLQVLHLNIGRGLAQNGRFSEARAEFDSALSLAESRDNARASAEVMNEMGRLDLRIADPQRARPWLDRARAVGDSLGISALQTGVRNNLAWASRLEGDPTGGESVAREALAIAGRAGDSLRVREAAVTLGQLAETRGDPRAAGEWYSRAAAISRADNLDAHADDLNNVALALIQNGNPDAAEPLYRRALALCEEVERPETHAYALLGLGDVAERRGQFATALAYDRAAANLGDTLRAQQSGQRDAIAVASGRRFALDALIHLLMKLDAQFPDSSYAAEAFHWAELARARALLDVVSAGAAQAAQPATLAQARALLTRNDEAFLEYSVGDSSTALWVITARGTTHHLLPPRRALQVRIEQLRRALADPDRATSRAALQSAAALYRMLIAPAGTTLAKCKRLIISTDGPLALIPFETLLAVEPAEGREPAAGDWLGARVAISYAFSAATYAARRNTPEGDGIVAVGNPSFGDASARRGPAGTGSMVPLSPLPNTAQELEALRALSGKRPFAELAQAAATREALLGLPALPAARLVHIATHGVADVNEPSRSGLWLSPSQAGEGPSFLSLDDIAGLRLDAALVTLSACQTGLGQLARGEGVIGLSRSFVAAGARGVMVSLWSVNDASTATLMQRFYEGWIRKGETADRALAMARQQLMKAPATRSPYFWAPFVLIGDAGAWK